MNQRNKNSRSQGTYILYSSWLPLLYFFLLYILLPVLADKNNDDDDDIDEGFQFIEHLCVSCYVKLFTYKLCYNKPVQVYYDADFVNRKLRLRKFKEVQI